VSDDLHSPTTAAPTPAAAGGGTATTPPTTAERLRDAAPEPVTHAAQQAAAAIATARQSVANAWSGEEQTASERPELLAGAAFAGGLLAAMILKRLSR
jgi:hypothetical protein